MNSNLVALVVTLVAWLGLFAYMLSLDQKVSKLEREKKR